MAEGSDRRSTTISRRRIEEVDSKYLSVKERAEKVWAQVLDSPILDDFSEYDITCFSCQWLGMLALGRLNNNEAFVELAKQMNRWLNSVHYSEAEAILGEKGDRDDSQRGSEAADDGRRDDEPEGSDPSGPGPTVSGSVEDSEGSRRGDKGNLQSLPKKLHDGDPRPEDSEPDRERPDDARGSTDTRSEGPPPKGGGDVVPPPNHKRGGEGVVGPTSRTEKKEDGAG